MRFRKRSPEPEQPSAPEEDAETDIARRVLAHASSPEEKLERLLAERSQELEERAARFEQALADLERREELLGDMRASVERMLRLGATDLTEREAELESLDRDVSERRARLSAEEAELERRRGELGAVELKREAVEQRERALAAREEELAAREAARAAESESASEATRESARLDLTPLTPDQASANGGERDDAVGLLFVPGTAYRLVEVESRTLSPGATVDLDGDTYAVTRIGPAPLPGDGRACAYLERVPPGSPASEGSS